MTKAVTCHAKVSANDLPQIQVKKKYIIFKLFISLFLYLHIHPAPMLRLVTSVTCPFNFFFPSNPSVATSALRLPPSLPPVEYLLLAFISLHQCSVTSFSLLNDEWIKQASLTLKVMIQKGMTERKIRTKITRKTSWEKLLMDFSFCASASCSVMHFDFHLSQSSDSGNHHGTDNFSGSFVMCSVVTFFLGLLNKRLYVCVCMCVCVQARVRVIVGLPFMCLCCAFTSIFDYSMT